MKNYVIITLVFSCLLLGCGKNESENEPENNSEIPVIPNYRIDDDLYPKNAKLKHVSTVESVKSEKTGFITSVYEYDDLGRISKVSYPMYEDGTPMCENGTIIGLLSYDIYVYNDKNQLEKIMNYHYNIYEGFINLSTYIYSYDKYGNKLKEVIVYPRALPSRTDSTLYYYDSNCLKRADEYYEGYHGNEIWTSKLITYIEYECDNQGKLVMETYYPAENNSLFSLSSQFTEDNKPKPYRTIVHNYQDGLNVKTEIDKIREIRRYYDKNDNLIYLESKELSIYSSMMSYVSMYEY